MSQLESYRKFGKIAQQWRDFAEGRRMAYAQLYDSGGWKIHYSQSAFQRRLREVVASAKRWDDIAAAYADSSKSPASTKPEFQLRQRPAA
jgi:hypothetical protein